MAKPDPAGARAGATCATGKDRDAHLFSGWRVRQAPQRRLCHAGCACGSPAVQRAGTRLVFWPRLARPRSDRAGLRPAQDALGTAAARTIDPVANVLTARQQTAPTPPAPAFFLGILMMEPLMAKPAPDSPALAEQLMEEVCDRGNLERAWKRVRSNKGSPG